MGTSHSKDVPVAQCERNLKWSLQQNAAWSERASHARELLGDGAAPRFHGSTGMVVDQLRAALAEVDRLILPETSSTAMSTGKPSLVQQLSGSHSHHSHSSSTASPSHSSLSSSSSSHDTPTHSSGHGLGLGLGSSSGAGAGTSSLDPFAVEPPVALPLSHPAHQFLASQFFGVAATKEIVLAHTQSAALSGANQAQQVPPQTIKTPPQDISQLTSWTRGRLEKVSSRLDLGMPGSSLTNSPRNLTAGAGAGGLVVAPTGSLATNPHLPLNAPLEPLVAGRANAAGSRSGSLGQGALYDTVPGQGNATTFPLGTGLAGLPAGSIVSQLSAVENRGVGDEPGVHQQENLAAPALASATQERIELVSKYLFISALLEKMIASAQNAYGLSSQIESLRKQLKPKRTKGLHPDSIASMQRTKEEHELLLRDNMELFFKSRLTLQWFYTDFNLGFALHLLHDAEVVAREHRDKLNQENYVQQPYSNEDATSATTGNNNAGINATNSAAVPTTGVPTAGSSTYNVPVRESAVYHGGVIQTEEQRILQERLNPNYALQQPGTFATPASHPLYNSPAHTSTLAGAAPAPYSTRGSGMVPGNDHASLLHNLDHALLNIESRRAQVELRLQANERTALSIAHYYLSRHSEGAGLRMSDAPELSSHLFSLLDTSNSQRVTRDQLQMGLSRLSESVDSLHARIRALQMHNESLPLSARGGQSSNMLSSNQAKIDKLQAELASTTNALRELNNFFLSTFVRNVFVNLAPEELPGATVAPQTQTVKEASPAAVAVSNLDAKGLLADVKGVHTAAAQVLNPLDVANQGAVGPDEILRSGAPVATGLPREHVATTIEESKQDGREAMRESGELPPPGTTFGASVQPVVDKAIAEAAVQPQQAQVAVLTKETEPQPILQQQPLVQEQPILVQEPAKEQWVAPQQLQTQQQSFEQPQQILAAQQPQSSPIRSTGPVGALLQKFKQIEETNLKNSPEVAQKTVLQKQQSQSQLVEPAPATVQQETVAVAAAPVVAASASSPNHLALLHRASSRALPQPPMNAASDKVAADSMRAGVPVNATLAPVLAPQDLKEGEAHLHHVSSADVKPSIYGGQHDRSMLPPALGRVPSNVASVNASLAPVVEPRALDQQAHQLAHVPIKAENHTEFGGITMHPGQIEQQPIVQQSIQPLEQPTSHPQWSEPAVVAVPAGIVMSVPPAVLASEIVAEAPPTRENAALAEHIVPSDLQSQKRHLDRVPLTEVVPSSAGGVHPVDAVRPIDRMQLQQHSHELHHVPIEKAPVTASGGVHLGAQPDLSVVPSQVSASVASNVALAEAVRPSELVAQKQQLDRVPLTEVVPSSFGGVHAVEAAASLPVDRVQLQQQHHQLHHVNLEAAPKTVGGGQHLIGQPDLSKAPSQISAMAASNVALARAIQPAELVAGKSHLEEVHDVQPSQYGGVHGGEADIGVDRVALQYTKTQLEHVPIEKAQVTASGGVHMIAKEQAQQHIIPEQVSASRPSNAALAGVVQPRELASAKRHLEQVTDVQPSQYGGVHSEAALLAAGPDRVAIQYVRQNELVHVPIEKAPVTASGGYHTVTQPDLSVVPSQVSAIAASNVALAPVIQPQDLRYEKRDLTHIDIEHQRPTMSGGIHMNDESAHVKPTLMEKLKSLVGMGEEPHMEAPGLGRVVPSPRRAPVTQSQAAMPVAAPAAPAPAAIHTNIPSPANRPPRPSPHDLQVRALGLFHVNINKIEAKRDLAAGVGEVTQRKATPRHLLKGSIVGQKPPGESAFDFDQAKDGSSSSGRSSPRTVFGEKEDSIVPGVDQNAILAQSELLAHNPKLGASLLGHEDSMTKESWTDNAHAPRAGAPIETQTAIRMQQPPHEEMRQ